MYVLGKNISTIIPHFSFIVSLKSKWNGLAIWTFEHFKNIKTFLFKLSLNIFCIAYILLIRIIDNEINN